MRKIYYPDLITPVHLMTYQTSIQKIKTNETKVRRKVGSVKDQNVVLTLPSIVNTVLMYTLFTSDLHTKGRKNRLRPQNY